MTFRDGVSPQLFGLNENVTAIRGKMKMKRRS